METIKQKAKLYLPKSNNPAADVECQITVHTDRRTQLRSWHGTLEILKEYQSIHPLMSQQLRVQLEDGRSGTLLITRHRIGTPGKTIFFQGTGLLK